MKTNRPTSTLWIPLMLALLVILVWGLSYAVTRVAVQEIPPFSLGFLRFALASLLIWPLARRYRRVRIAREDRLGVFLLGFVGVTLYFGFENLGLRFTTASHGALIIATIPLCTEIAEALRRRRPPTARAITGLVLALAGVVLIIGRSSGGASLGGDLLMIGAVLTWVWYTFIAHRLVQRYPNLLLTCRIMVVGALTMLPLAAVEAWLFPFGPPSTGAWGGVVFLGVVCSALAFHLWNQAIPRLGVSITNNLLYGIPLVGVLTGVVVLGEPMTPSIMVGGGLILGGVLLACQGAKIPEEAS